MKKYGKGVIFLSIGFELIGICTGGYYLGDFIDQKMGWKAVGSTYLVLLLLIGWFVHLIYLLRRFETENDDDNPSS
jgi:hypothetical protein